GARAAAPPIPGLAEAGYLTNESVFSLAELPGRLAVLGAGPIGSELSQTFQRLGTSVTLLERGPQILPREDQAAAQLVEEAIKRDGARVLTGITVTRVDCRGGEKVLKLDHKGAALELTVDEILVGAGRVPNVTGLGLEAAGVEYDEVSGIK